MTVIGLETPLEAVLRDHGATIAVRHGHRVAAHFGSAASETAVCVRSVGLTDRFGRVTLDVRGGRDGIAAALAGLDRVGGRGWGAALGPTHAVVRCEAADELACRAALDDDDLVVEPSGERAALGLVGPHAGAVLRAANLPAAPFDAVALVEPWGFEVLVPLEAGPAAWTHLLHSGRPFEIACVGFDAIEHLAVSRHAARQ